MQLSFLIDCGGLNNWEIQIGESCRFKKGLAHYRRARENLTKEERINRLPPRKDAEDVEIKFDQTPRADFAKVKESLTGVWHSLSTKSLCSRSSLFISSYL